MTLLLEERDETYLKRELELHMKVANKIIDNIKYWKELTIFTYSKNRYLDKHLINPELLAFSIAHEIWRRHQISSIVMINNTYMDAETILEVASEVDNPPLVLKFGVDNSRVDITPKIKIEMNFLKRHGRILGKIVKSIAPEKGREISEKDFEKIGSLSDLCELLIRSLEPPRIEQIIASKLMKRSSEGAIGAIIDLAELVGGLVFSPISFAPKSIKAVQEIIKAIKSSREDLYDEWRRALRNSFKIEVMEQMFAPNGMRILESKIPDTGWAVIVNVTDETIYEPLSFYMLLNALNVVMKKINGKILTAMPDSDSLIQVPAAGVIIRKVAMKSKRAQLAYVFRGRALKYPGYIRLIRKYVRDRVVIFDMPSNLFDKIFDLDKISTAANLIRNLAKIASIRRMGAIAFTFKDRGNTEEWKIDKVPIHNSLTAQIGYFIAKVAGYFSHLK